MNFLKMILASLAFGLVARPYLDDEKATALAVTGVFVMLILSAVHETEKTGPISPLTKKFLSPFENRYVFLALQIYTFGWMFAHTTVSQFVRDLLR